ncbi:hypothetical protein RF55_19575 [Lasius niger]|uniref:Reverse transcriptase n=1 Tax=Lasius niger TaxID=67767 RepID=A0A0J7JZK6_LASNI|nr:hypothetical protein RF55_19575 [Lasius niger]
MLLKKEAWKKTQECIVEESRFKGKDYFKRFYDGNRKRPWFRKIRRERYFYTFINRIRANHYNLNEFLARKEYIDSSRCECGSEKENVNHVIRQCRKYEKEREVMDVELVKRNIAEDVLSVIEREKTG